MFQGKEYLRGMGEKIEYTPEMIQEIIRCKTDIIYFAEKYFKVMSSDGNGFKVIKLREYQKRIIKALTIDPDLQNIKAWELPHRILMTPRQQGKTTMVSLFILHDALFGEEGDIAIMAQVAKTAIEILDRVKIAYKELPLFLQQGIDESRGGFSKTCIALENKVRVFASATSEDGMRGFSIRLLYLDEFAVIPKNIIEPFYATVYGTISGRENARIIISSTPKGINLFYEIWKKAIQGDNSFLPIKVGWWEMPGRDEKWKTKTIENVGLKKFLQEFECQFIGSTNTLVSAEGLEKQTRKDPIDLKYGGLFEIYKKRDPSKMYVLGVDTGKGIGADSSCIQVLEISSKEDIDQIAYYNNDQILPYDFAEVVHEISQEYDAYIMLENNDQGATVGDRLWYDFQSDKMVNCDKHGFGIRSTKKSKPTACLHLKRLTDHGKLRVYNQETIRQLSLFEEISLNKFGAPKGEHDDAVTALIWGAYFTQTPFFDDIKLVSDIKKDSEITQMQDDDTSVYSKDLDMPMITNDDDYSW